MIVISTIYLVCSYERKYRIELKALKNLHASLISFFSLQKKACNELGI